jgi:hypothetical protein
MYEIIARAEGAIGSKIEDEIAQGIAVPCRCIVHFRPPDNYKGEFGFDWLRTKNNIMDKEPAYEDIIISGYNGATDFTKHEAYNALKNEYKSFSIFGFRDPYYVPYLNLFSKEYSNKVKINPAPPYKAKLKVFVEIKDADVDKLEFVFNKNIFSINDKDAFSLNQKSRCGLKFAEEIEITCKKDITNDADGRIDVFANHSKPYPGRKLAGRIIVGKNGAANRREPKFVFVCVKTNINKVEQDCFSEAEQAQLRQTLYQALVNPMIFEKRKNLLGFSRYIILDMTKDPKFKKWNGVGTMTTFIDAAGNAQMGTPAGESLVKYLKTKFRNDPNNAQYINCIPVFVIGVPGGSGGLFGYSDSNRGTKGNLINFIQNSVSFTPSGMKRPVEVMPHEALHGLQMYHTHRDGPVTTPLANRNIKYIFPHGQKHNPTTEATDNVMSYRGGYMRMTWCWQWEIIKSTI